MVPYTFRPSGAQLGIWLLVLTVIAAPLNRVPRNKVPLLRPLRITFTPLGAAVQQPPDTVHLLQNNWTTNKRLVFLVEHRAFRTPAQKRVSPSRPSRPVLLTGVGNSRLARSPPSPA